MSKKVKILIILLLVFNSCQERVWDNPFDPDCPKEAYTPSNFKAEQQGNTIKLSWNHGNTNITGFKIERKIGSGSWTYFSLLNKTHLYKVDEQIIGGEVHLYRLTAYAGPNESNQVTTQMTPVTAPSCTTSPVTIFTSNAANFGGNVTSDGGANVTDRGICYGTSQNPTVSGSELALGTGIGSFTSTISDLNVNTTYFVRAYAINSKGISYGNQVSFKTDKQLTDLDGNIYKTVIIGDQVWMAENLKYLPKVSIDTSRTESCYYVYGYTGTNLTEAKAKPNYNTYGVLYNWPAAMISCPNGWHLPADAEWEILAEYVSTQKGPYSKYNSTQWRGVGKHLKSKGTINGGDGLWMDSSISDIGTDDFNFSGLPSGNGNAIEGYQNMKAYCWWWSSTEISPSNAWVKNLGYYHNYFTAQGPAKNFSISVRCIKN